MPAPQELIDFVNAINAVKVEYYPQAPLVPIPE